MSKEVIKSMITLATSAFGLVAALAWNEAIQSLFKQIFGAKGSLISLFLYAVAVTIIAVLVTSRLGKIAERVDTKKSGHR
ncbi:MAG: DUF5654 family protein [Patescibacteria group bacterium]|jgi:choline-glycine betaine transporter